MLFVKANPGEGSPLPFLFFVLGFMNYITFNNSNSHRRLNTMITLTANEIQEAIHKELFHIEQYQQFEDNIYLKAVDNAIHTISSEESVDEDVPRIEVLNNLMKRFKEVRKEMKFYPRNLFWTALERAIKTASSWDSRLPSENKIRQEAFDHAEEAYEESQLRMAAHDYS